MAGRESSYVARYAEQAYKLCLLGATDERLANFFDVSVSTINNWKKEHPEFVASIKEGKEEADANVASRLYSRAMGYSHPAVKIFMPAGSSEPVYADYTEHHPPDTTAAIFWLKNRDKANWRDRHETSTTINAGDPLMQLLLDISGANQKIFEKRDGDNTDED